MPTAILLGVTGVSRAPALVLDVQNGYLDRLLMTPMRRIAILLGHLVADVAIAVGLAVPILVLGLVLGTGFETGVVGALVFLLLAALWSLAFAGFGYAVALKTGNPAAVQSVFLLFFPFLFLTTSYVPERSALRLARRRWPPSIRSPTSSKGCGRWRSTAGPIDVVWAMRRHRRRRCAEHVAVPGRPPEPGRRRAEHRERSDRPSADAAVAAANPPTLVGGGAGGATGCQRPDGPARRRPATGVGVPGRGDAGGRWRLPAGRRRPSPTTGGRRRRGGGTGDRTCERRPAPRSRASATPPCG